MQLRESLDAIKMAVKVTLRDNIKPGVITASGMFDRSGLSQTASVFHKLAKQAEAFYSENPNAKVEDILQPFVMYFAQRYQELIANTPSDLYFSRPNTAANQLCMAVVKIVGEQLSRPSWDILTPGYTIRSLNDLIGITSLSDKTPQGFYDLHKSSSILKHEIDHFKDRTFPNAIDALPEINDVEKSRALYRGLAAIYYDQLEERKEEYSSYLLWVVPLGVPRTQKISSAALISDYLNTAFPTKTIEVYLNQLRHADKVIDEEEYKRHYNAIYQIKYFQDRREKSNLYALAFSIDAAAKRFMQENRLER